MGRSAHPMLQWETGDRIEAAAAGLEHVDTVGAMHLLYQTARELAPLPVDVLIEGETGVGKDTLAKEMHEMSGRPGQFIALNCAAIPETLAESELFGAEAGAYTGAIRSRPGRIEAAHRGTLYLDEIDSMPMNLQAKLLRVLQERGCERVGSQKFVRFDLRVIASTKLPFERLIAQDRFRADLYHRLNVVSLRIPPLRERVADILPLFRRFVGEAAQRIGRKVPRYDPALDTLLLTHPWSGNVRELRAAADRCVLGLPVVHAASPLDCEQTLRERLRCIERVLIRSALERHAGSVQRASQELKVPVHTLYYRLRTLGIEWAN